MAGCQIEHALLGNRSLLPRRFYPRMECNKCVALFLGWHLGGFIWGFAADPATRWFGDDLQMTRSCAGFLKRQLCITGEAFLGWSLGVLNCPNVAVTSQPPNSTPLPVHQPQPRPENGGGGTGAFLFRIVQHCGRAPPPWGCHRHRGRAAGLAPELEVTVAAEVDPAAVAGGDSAEAHEGQDGQV